MFSRINKQWTQGKHLGGECGDGGLQSLNLSQYFSQDRLTLAGATKKKKIKSVKTHC